MALSENEIRQFTEALSDATRALREQTRASADAKRGLVSAGGLGGASLAVGGAALAALAPAIGAASRGAESPLGVAAGGITSGLAKVDPTGILGGFTNPRDATEKRIADITSDLAAAGAPADAIEGVRRSLLGTFGPQERRRADERQAVADFSSTEEFRQVFDRGNGAAGAQTERVIEELLREGIQLIRDLVGAFKSSPLGG